MTEDMSTHKAAVQKRYDRNNRALSESGAIPPATHTNGIVVGEQKLYADRSANR
jgi:hypothetical protein